MTRFCDGEKYKYNRKGVIIMRKATGNRRVIRAISLGLVAFLAVSAPMTVCAEPGGESASVSGEAGGAGSSESGSTGSSESGGSGITEQKTTGKVDNGDGSQTVTTTTTVTTDQTIEAGSKEEKDAIVEEQTDKQEELKQDIEEKGGSYDYEITVTDQSTTEHKSGTADTEEAARQLATDDKGINVSVEKKENTETVTIQKDGYHIDYDREKGIYTITITGGLDQIEIPLFDDFNTVAPGWSCDIKITIQNESNDDYVVSDYVYEQQGPYKWIHKSKWNDTLGEIKGTFPEGSVSNYEDYYIYIPADDCTEGYNTGIANTKTIPHVITAWYQNKYGVAKKEAEQKIRNHPDVYLEYYNDRLGVSGSEKAYTDLYDAWCAYFNELCWEMTVEGKDPEAYFADMSDVEAGSAEEISLHASLDGPNTDNPYMNTYWSFVAGLILKIKPIPATYQAKVEYNHTFYNYQVDYDAVTESYRIDIDGVGSYQVIDRVITRLPDDDHKGGGGSKSGGSSSASTTVIDDAWIPLTDSIVLPDEAVPLADSVVIPDEDEPLADSVPQTGDSAFSLFPGLTAGLAAFAGALGLRRKEKECGE